MSNLIKKLIESNSITYYHEEILGENGELFPPCPKINVQGDTYMERYAKKGMRVLKEYANYLVLYDQGSYGYLLGAEGEKNEVVYFEISTPEETSYTLVYSSYIKFEDFLNSVNSEVPTSEEKDKKYYQLSYESTNKGKKLLKFWNELFTNDIKVHGYLAEILVSYYEQINFVKNHPSYSNFISNLETKNFSKFTNSIKRYSDKKLSSYDRVVKIAKRKNEKLPEHIMIAVNQGFYSPDNIDIQEIVSDF